MAMGDMIRTVLGIIGNIISLCLFLSPAATFYNIWKWKSTRKYSGIPYVATLLNCMLWVFYGIPIVHPNSILVVTINGTGVFLEVIYVTMFVIYCSKDSRPRLLKMLAVAAVFFAAVVVLTLTLAHTHDKRSLIVGLLCVVFGTCMYAAPLAAIRNVVRTKSVKYMPFSLSLASFANGAIWMAYACIHFDIFITVILCNFEWLIILLCQVNFSYLSLSETICCYVKLSLWQIKNVQIPNGLGAFLGALQLILYGIYYKTTVWGDDEEVDKVEGPA